MTQGFSVLRAKVTMMLYPVILTCALLGTRLW